MKRSIGRSAVAAAAYRSGECLHDEQTDLTHDYTRKKGIEASFIIAPAHSPDWAKDTGKLWNAAEAAEKRINSQTAREIELALPAGVSPEERAGIARDLAAHLVERYGVAVGVALHEPSRQGDERNHHAHILMTTRRMGAEGLTEKTRELDDRKTGGGEVLHIREYAAELINSVLADAGSDERVDHRSFKDRGIEQLPSKHLGVEAAAMERRGRHSDRGDLNREIEQTNQTLEALTKERGELDKQIAEASQQPPEPQQDPPHGRSGSYWQDRIKQEQEDEAGSSGGGFRPADPPPSVATDSDYSIFDEPSEKAHKAQILEHGEIIHRDLGRSWLDHALEYAHELDNAIIEIWEVFKGGGNPDTVDFEDLDDHEQELWERLREEGRTPAPAEPTHGIEAQGEIEALAPEPAPHKNFWQRLVGGKEATEPFPAVEGKPSGNRFQQLTQGVTREADSPAPSGKGADYWRKAREGVNLTEANKPSNEIDHDNDIER